MLTVGGKIGPLQIDKSNRAAVVAFAGKPDEEVQSITYGLSSCIVRMKPGSA